MKRLSLIIVVFSAVIMFAACGKSNANYKALLANEWSLDKIIYADSNYSVDAPENVYIIFADSNRVSGRGGCNNFFGRYDVLGEDQIAIEDMGSTRMFCNDGGFENRYFELLRGVATYQAGTHELIMSGIDNKFQMQFSVRIPGDEDVISGETIQEEGVGDAVEAAEGEPAPVD